MIIKNRRLRGKYYNKYGLRYNIIKTSIALFLYSSFSKKCLGNGSFGGVLCLPVSILEGDGVEVVENAKSESCNESQGNADIHSQCSDLCFIILVNTLGVAQKHTEDGSDEGVAGDKEDDNEDAVVDEYASVGGNELVGGASVLFFQPLTPEEGHDQSWCEVHDTKDDENPESGAHEFQEVVDLEQWCNHVQDSQDLHTDLDIEAAAACGLFSVSHFERFDLI